MTAHDHIEHAIVFVAELILIQLAEPHAGLQHDVPRAWFKIAAQHLHERRLAGAVGPDEAVTIAVGKLDGDLFKEGLGAELDGDVGSRKHVCPIN
jgi:hypothetical protein